MMKRAPMTMKIVGLIWVFMGICITALSQPLPVTATGDSNSGDVWTDNTANPSGPGHEQDPHLTCTNINLFGSNLADSSGTYTIDGWAPTGSGASDYASSWTYNTSSGGTQIISVINVNTLIANAQANGDVAQPQQGYHFKLQFVQDPQKHKVFWVNCATGGGTGGSSSSPTPTPTGSVSGSSASPSPTPTGSVSGSNATPSPTPSGSVGGSNATPTPIGSVSGITSSGNSTPVGGVQGITTGSGAPSISGGVLGISTTAPLTGTPLQGSGFLMILLGFSLMGASRVIKRK